MTTEATPTPRRPSALAYIINWAINIALLAILSVGVYLAWPFVVARWDGYDPVVRVTATPAGAVFGQAPPAVRGTNGGASAVGPAIVATPIPGIAQNEATAQAMYDAAVQSQPAAPIATPAPLPLNSAGEPVIDAAQQEQMQQSLQMAEQEGAAAADAELAHQRQEANQDALSRPPDVSYEDAKALLHRDPCHVPRANPATCAQGLFKPTPIGDDNASQ